MIQLSLQGNLPIIKRKTAKYAIIDFKSNPEYSNPILKKGESIEFSGKDYKRRW